VREYFIGYALEEEEEEEEEEERERRHDNTSKKEREEMTKPVVKNNYHIQCVVFVCNRW
jgi:hypothetical protein